VPALIPSAGRLAKLNRRCADSSRLNRAVARPVRRLEIVIGKGNEDKHFPLFGLDIAHQYEDLTENSRALLPLRTAEITDACARSMDPAAPAMQMLSGYLGRLFEVADDLTASQRLDAGRAAIDLLALVLRDLTPSVLGGDGSEGVLLDMMRMHVREHLADPNLRVEELARRHHVSVRQAYSLFERIGTTPGAYLRKQRLIAAQAMLSDPRHGWLRVSDIAAAVGFLDIRTFERAFRRQYGMTPASWRREHRHSGSAH
jgi:AraC-like DNA-binding protein